MDLSPDQLKKKNMKEAPKNKKFDFFFSENF